MPVKIAYSGELVEGFTTQEVIEGLSKLFRTPPSRIAPLFSGKTVVIKECESKEEADRVVARLKRAGALARTNTANEQNLDSLIKPKQVAPPPKKTDTTTRNNTHISHGRPTQNSLPDTNATEPPAPAVKCINWTQHFKYRIDTFMSKGSSSSFKALTTAFMGIFFLIAAFRGLLQFSNPEMALQYENLDFLGNVYITFLQLTDPGNMAQDILSSSWYKLFAIISGLAGIVLLSALIALITTALDQKLTELKRGHSKVIEKDHTLILGWNEQRIVEIIREIILANESEDDGCIVILADKEKESMDDILRLQIPERLTTRIVTRSGRVSTLANLDLVSIEDCRSIIIIGSSDDTATPTDHIKSDADVIQTLLAASAKNSKDDVNIVAEVFNDTYREIIESSFPSSIVTINKSEILAKLLVQTSRSVGLSVVYSEILSFDGCEMYFHAENDWRDLPFGELAYYFPDGVPMGVRHTTGDLELNPPVDYIMQKGDEIVIVADDDSTIEFAKDKVAAPNKIPLVSTKLEQQTESELLIGWNHKASIIIKEFADYVIEGSVIDVMVQNPTESNRLEIQSLNDSIENIQIDLKELNPLDRDDLLELDPFNYDNIIILASTGEDLPAQQIDSENIVTLLLLRSIFDSHPEQSQSTKLITEILESQNQPLVAQAGVKDIIISNQLVSMIVAQISEDSDIKDVYDDIFEEDGSEIYLKPISLYIQESTITATFADLIDLAQQRGEVCIGVKLKHQEANSEENYGVKLIPLKDTEFTLNLEDSLVVLAEDEL